MRNAPPALHENFGPGFGGKFVLRFSVIVALLFGAWTVFLYFALDRDFEGGYGLAIFSLAHVQSTLFRYVLYSTIVQAAVLAILVGSLAARLAKGEPVGPVPPRIPWA